MEKREARKNCLIKISGDVYNDEMFSLIKILIDEYFVVICTGGGTQINEAFKEVGFPVVKFGPLGRETTSFEERQLSRDILEKNQESLQDRLANLGLNVSVVIPVLYIGSVMCHVNGDQYVLSAYHGFDKIIIMTTEERKEAKAEFFKLYPKIEVKAFPNKKKEEK